MSKLVDHHLVRAIANIAVFLEFTSEDLLDPDAAVEAMEQLATELQLLDSTDRVSVAHQLKSLSAEYVDIRKAEFLINLPGSLGLE
jgi:hypothetical protein